MIDSKIFIDGKGKLSSKRVIGIICFGIAIIMGVHLYIVSTMIMTAHDSATAIEIVEGFLMAGATLLGVGIFEKKK